MLLEICRLKLYWKKFGRKTGVINIYKNWIRRDYIWDNGIRYIKRALKDINREPII